MDVGPHCSSVVYIGREMEKGVTLKEEYVNNVVKVKTVADRIVSLNPEI